MLFNNVLGIVLSTILAQFLGAMWYSVLFGRQWVANVYPGKTMSDMQKEGHNPMLYAGALLSAFSNSVIADALIRLFGAVSLAESMRIAAVLSFANMATTIPHYGFKGFGTRVYAIEMAHDTVGLAMIYAVISATN